MRTGSSLKPQAARPAGRGERREGGGVRLQAMRTTPSSAVWRRPFPASSWISKKEGRMREGKRAKTSADRANGQPRRIEWREGKRAKTSADRANGQPRRIEWHEDSAWCSYSQPASE